MASTKNLNDLEKQQRRLFNTKKAGAKRGGRAFNLVFEDIVWPERCPVTGHVLNYSGKAKDKNTASFDRLDSSQDYVKGNVFIISLRANLVKRDGTEKEHRQIARWMAEQTPYDPYAPCTHC